MEKETGSIVKPMQATSPHSKCYKFRWWIAAIGALVGITVFLMANLGNLPIVGYKFQMRDVERAKEVRMAAQGLFKKYRPANQYQLGNSIPPEHCPPPIRRMNPNSVSILYDRVHIEFGNGFQHHGLDCFPDGVVGEGDSKIIDGLWFVTER
jgi:hypothetical protein